MEEEEAVGGSGVGIGVDVGPGVRCYGVARVEESLEAGCNARTNLYHVQRTVGCRVSSAL
jgi:hypothetical protein